MNAKPQNESMLWRRLGRKFWIPFVLACLLVLSMEAIVDHVAESGELPGITQSVFNISGLYQRIVAAPRTPVPRYTEVVEINPTKDPSTPTLLHICDQREMTARLLRSVALALPRAVILDKHYEPQSKPCAKDSDFIHAVQELREANIPVVVGRRVADEPIKEGGDERYYLKPSLDFGFSGPCSGGLARSGQACMEGVTALSNDTRKLPLEWKLYADAETAKAGQGLSWHDTLALSAARAYDPKLMEHHPRLVPFVRKAQHPYVSFFPAEEIEPIPAGTLLARDLLSGQEAKALSLQTLPPDLRKLSGKIVLIGEINGDFDIHPTVLGKVPGLYLQANYIEALLDDRYFRPMPVLDYVTGFVILFVLELILMAPGHWWTKALLVAALFVVSLGVLYLFIKLPGWYVNPGALGVVAILIKIIQPLFGRAEKAAEGKAAAAGEA